MTTRQTITRVSDLRYQFALVCLDERRYMRPKYSKHGQRNGEELVVEAPGRVVCLHVTRETADKHCAKNNRTMGGLRYEVRDLWG